MDRTDLEDVGRLRPWLDGGGGQWVRLKDGRTVAHDPTVSRVGPAVLTKKQWDEGDELVARACQYRMCVTNLIGTLSGVKHLDTQLATPTVLKDADQHATDHPLQGLPLPITWVPLERLDRLEVGARRVAEGVERVVLGVERHGLGVQGLCGIFDHPRAVHLTGKVTEITGSAADLERAIELLLTESISRNHHGPWVLLHSSDLDRYLDNDCSTVLAGDMLTVRQKVCAAREISGVGVRLLSVTRADHLTGLRMALVQVTPDVIELVTALKPTLVMWDKGFLVVAIVVPRIRPDKDGNVGIVTLTAE